MERLIMSLLIILVGGLVINVALVNDAVAWYLIVALWLVGTVCIGSGLYGIWEDYIK